MNGERSAVDTAIAILDASMSRAERLIQNARRELRDHRHGLTCFTARWCYVAEAKISAGTEWHRVCLEGAGQARGANYDLAIAIRRRMTPRPAKWSLS